MGVAATVLVSYGAAVLLMTASVDRNRATIVAQLSHQRLVTHVIVAIYSIGASDI